jgi:hypothetical protein
VAGSGAGVVLAFGSGVGSVVPLPLVPLSGAGAVLVSALGSLLSFLCFLWSGLVVLSGEVADGSWLGVDWGVS